MLVNVLIPKNYVHEDPIILGIILTKIVTYYSETYAGILASGLICSQFVYNYPPYYSVVEADLLNELYTSAIKWVTMHKSGSRMGHLGKFPFFLTDN